jgi:hypothetical protein
MARSTRPEADPTRKAARLRFRPRRRHLLIAVGLWLAIVGNAEAKELGIGIATVILFSLIPSLPLLLGIGQPKRPGGIAARAVRPFNLTHEPALPLAVFALGASGVLPGVALAGGLVWLGSIVIAWGLGDGLREADGSLRPIPARVASWPTLRRGPGEVAAA